MSFPSSAWPRLSRRSVARLGLAAGSGFIARDGGRQPVPDPVRVAPDLVTEQPTDQYDLGRFRFVLSPAGHDGDPFLQISHQAEPDHVLWSSLPGGGFLGAGQGDATIKENTAPASGFRIRDTVRVRCDRQRLDGIDLAAETLTLRGSLIGDDASVEYTMTWTALGEDEVQFHVRLHGPDAAAFNRLFLRYAAMPGERFFGFGQQLTYFDQTGRVLPILVQEHGVGRGLPIVSQLVGLRFGQGSVGSPVTTEVAVPQYLTNQRRSLWLETTEYAVFDLSATEQVSLTLFASKMIGRVLYGKTPLDLIATYTSSTGRMRALPEWIHEGAVVAVQGGTDRAMSKLDELVAADVPVAAFWIQDWVGQRQTPAGKQLWWDWQLDEQHYPNWDTLVDALQEWRDARMLIYINPFLANQAGRDQLFQEAVVKGYLVKNRQGDPYLIPNAGFSAGLLDLSNPEAREWIKGIIKDELISHAGACGWMADFGEALPFDAVLASGEDPAVWHNRYPEEWARVNREAITEAGRGEDIVFFTRSGYTRSPAQTTLSWLGDQLQTWDGYDGIKTAVVGALSGGISGFSLVHSDTGGFDSISLPLPAGHTIPLVARSKELLMRWMELSAFTTVYRTHEGIDPAAAWQYDSDAETLTFFKRTAEIYRAWGFYRKTLVAEAATSGHPVMRHLVLHYADDAVVPDLRYQYLLGTELLVAPVLDPGADTVRVYLPAGGWTHVWSGQEYGPAGAWHEVPAPIGQPAVFVRTGSDIGHEFVAALRSAGLMPE